MSGGRVIGLCQFTAQDRIERLEGLLLPSVVAQSDPDFEFWLLVPPVLLADLRGLCRLLPHVHVLPRTAPVETMLRPRLRRVARAGGGPALQFRIGPGDALGRNFVARLRAHARRFADLGAFAISLAQGVVLDEHGIWRVHQPFTETGLAMRLQLPSRSIYSRRPAEIPRHVPAFSDSGGLNYLTIRHGEGAARQQHPMDPDAFRQAVAAEFPFLDGIDPEILRPEG